MEGALLFPPDTGILPARAPHANMAALAKTGKRARIGSAGGSAGAYGDTRVIQDQAAGVVDQRAGEAEGGSGVTGIRLELRSARPAGLQLQAASGLLPPATQRNWVAARLGVTLRDR